MLKFESKVLEKAGEKPIKWELKVDNGYDKWTMELDYCEMFDLFDITRKMFNDHNLN